MKYNISGNYRHYKGNKYTVYCVAKDIKENFFVLYEQNYGEHKFWIRPYDMFFENVTTADNITVARFKRVDNKSNPEQLYNKLIGLIRSNRIDVKHSETECPYIITSITRKKDSFSVIVYPDLHALSSKPGISLFGDSKGGTIAYPYFDNSAQEGYLTQYEILRRFGKNCCLIENKLEIWEAQNPPLESRRLQIIGYSDEDIKQLINPCSIDLKIAETGFLKAKFKAIDPESIEHASKASDLWKKARVRKSRKNGTGNYFVLWPGQTVLTHTANRIKLPIDCAGKIEIKSSYARLSLSITFGDFCNPGYDGFFPLEITNHGKHIIYLHGGSVMGQLMLIPVMGPVLIEYSRIATQRNAQGYDDGTPYTFWYERNIKRIRTSKGGEAIIELYESLRKQISSSTVEDINASKMRLDDTFLTYCQNRIHKEKYYDESNGQLNIMKVVNDYISHEKWLHRFYSTRWISLLVGSLGIIIDAISLLSKRNSETITSFLVFSAVVATILIGVYGILQFKRPKAFCEFNKIDIEKALKAGERREEIPEKAGDKQDEKV